MPSHRTTALRKIASNTGSTSVGELLMTRRISLVAVCCSSAALRSALRARVLEEWTFSMG
jgi:hypothetical protein